MPDDRQTMNGSLQAPRGNAGPRWRRYTRKHQAEGIEDTVNVLGAGLVGLGIAALALTLVAAGYGFGGWAVIAAVACAVLLLAGSTVIVTEWRRRRRGSGPSSEMRQGH
ncbi:hypothetical protein [Nocardia sp. NPDC020380]|uniref:hypothetical protein n=1 Tax=Nocardia sp. NPDC020380 TaxID=3364309 RepID=UPI0037A44F34